jgi:ATP phosphoribosyltransferase regulatory subunit HisZ
MKGEQLANILDQLAEISAIAFSLKYELEPLTPEDIQAGAEPLSQDQIQGSLDKIQSMITMLAMIDLKATREEWYAANNGVQ